MSAMSMAGKPGRSGRKSTRDDKQLLADMRAAEANKPPARVVRSWKSTVRKAVTAKKKR